jgi:hypothetical protein
MLGSLAEDDLQTIHRALEILGPLFLPQGKRPR